jgi:hypothetical protein
VRFFSATFLRLLETYGFLSADQYHNLTTVIPQSIEITLSSSIRTSALPGNLHVTVHKSTHHIYPGVPLTLNLPEFNKAYKVV